jgi:hypothetical protein
MRKEETLNAPVESTYYSDPAACFTVSSIGPLTGGIDGYFTNEFDAHRVARYLKGKGHQNVSVAPYDPNDNKRVGSDSLAKAFIQGY